MIPPINFFNILFIHNPKTDMSDALKIQIKQDPRFKHPLSLRFGCVEYTNEEYEKKKRDLIKCIGLFILSTSLTLGYDFFINK